MIIVSNYKELTAAVREYADNLGVDPDQVAECHNHPDADADYAVNIPFEMTKLYNLNPVQFTFELFEELSLKVYGNIRRDLDPDSTVHEYSNRSTGRLEVWC